MAIVIHAGMPKAGSTSIQHWLADNSTDLRQRGIVVMAAPRDDAERIAFTPYEGGKINSGWILESVARRQGEEAQRQAVGEFVDSLAAAAERYGDVVVSAEVLAYPFWALHAPTLEGLQRLSTSHPVRVAYYVRPQHTSLEAGWREFGWYRRMPPSTFLERRAMSLHYAATRRGVREAAPAVDFEPRPFREDLLDDGDLIADFAGRYLGVEASGTGERANRGLPLEVVSVLRASPPGMFWQRSFVSKRVDRIKDLLDGWTIPSEERIALSRRVLQKYAHEMFAAENTELGWPDFVPPPEHGEEIPGLEAVDELWAPQASAAELALMFHALDTAV